MSEMTSLNIIKHDGTMEYRGIFPRYLPWHKISGTAQHYANECTSRMT